MDFSASTSIPSLGKIRLTKLTPGHVTEMLRSMEPRGLSPATFNAAKKVIGRALHRAMQEDLIYRKAAYIADSIRVKRKDRRRSMTRFGNFPVAGWNISCSSVRTRSTGSLLTRVHYALSSIVADCPVGHFACASL